MKILIISDHFPPEVCAPAARNFDHARQWVKEGHEVTIVTCFPNFPIGKVYEGYKNKLIQKDKIEGINVIRIWSFIAENEGFIFRLLDFLSFAFLSFFVSLFVKTDIVLTTSPQFFINYTGLFISKIKRIRWVFEIRDIWPESIRTLGMMKSDAIYNFFEAQELWLYKKASKIIVVTNSFKENLISRGVDGKKIVVVLNGIYVANYLDVKITKPISKLENKFVITYLGTHGIAHGLSFILNCAKRLEDKYPDILFVFVGEGAEKRNLIQQNEKLNLKNTVFFDAIPKSEVPNMLLQSSVCLVNLRKTTTFEGVIPSKIFEITALGKPILLGVEGESKKLLEGKGFCWIFRPEDEEDFILKVQEVYQLIKGNDNISGKARDFAKSYDRGFLAGRILKEVFLEN